MLGNSSNSSLSNIVVLATISSSVLSLSYDISDANIPVMRADYEHHLTMRGDWKDSAFNPSSDYYLDEDSQSSKIQTILKFSNDLIKNSKDLDSEYVDIVNENFWDLI
ncbi:hypothetical protein HC174_01535 [Salinimicrobium sp. CDJ15-81-2]|nr:hypothetical protein [Salinimicrobium nanhaiense]